VGELRLQVADNAPVSDQGVGITAERHPPGQAVADAGKEYSATVRMKTARESIDYWSHVADVNWRKRESGRTARVRHRDPAGDQLLPQLLVSLAWTGELDDLEVIAGIHGATISRAGDIPRPASLYVKPELDQVPLRLNMMETRHILLDDPG
jgi:hypothetical protein